MKDQDKYFELLREFGRPLAEINPGSSEVALSCEKAGEAIEILKELNRPILGGDIVSERNGSILYAYQAWGSKYISLNWYCKKEPEEEAEAFVRRSLRLAEERIDDARTVASQLGQECFVVLVT